MVNFEGRVVLPEKVYMGRKALTQDCSEWSKSMRGERLDSVENIIDWIIVYPSEKGGKEVVDKFISNIINVSRGMGLDVGEPTVR